jgi:hypothetical protein
MFLTNCGAGSSPKSNNTLLQSSSHLTSPSTVRKSAIALGYKMASPSLLEAFPTKAPPPPTTTLRFVDVRMPFLNLPFSKTE